MASAISRSEAHHFLVNLLEDVLPKGDLSRLHEFYTEDVIGHFREEEFGAEEIKGRFLALQQNMEKHRFEVIDFIVFDNFISALIRQSWKDIHDGTYREAIVSGIYRMREGRACEVWFVIDADLPSYRQVNADFSVLMKPFALDEKDKAAFLRRLRNSHYFHKGIKVELSAREEECLYYYLNGFSAKEIAKKIDISYRTIEDYLSIIKSKYGCSTKAQLRKIIFPKKE